jgi:hypothetical protein
MQKVVHIFAATLIFVTITIAPASHADWMNLTGADTAPNIAEITILEDRVHVALEVYVGDLATFEKLLPDEWFKSDVDSRPGLSERLRQFSDDTLQIITDDGTRLQASLGLAEPRLRKERTSAFAGMINPMTKQRVSGSPEDKRVFYAELEYPFPGKPESLTITPPQNEKGTAAVNIGFIAYHKTVPIIDFRYLSGPSKVNLDWDDPWYTKFDNKNLKRHHKSAMMSFLYVEPREIRHEVLIRVRDLLDWVDLGLDDRTTISSADKARIKERALSFFTERNPLKIDGVSAAPIPARADFLNISLTGLQVVEENQPLDLATALIGIILSYPVKQLPQHVTVQWDLFSERVKQFPATAIDPAGPFLNTIDISNPTIEWRNFLKKYQEPKVFPVVVDDNRSIGVPILTILLLVLALSVAVLGVRSRGLSNRAWIAASGLSAVAAVLLLRVAVVDMKIPFSGPPDENTSVKIVTDVINNLNTAYLEKDPDSLQQALGVVVATETLPDVESELGRALAINVAGGGIARVDSIENLVLKEITSLEHQSGFRALAEWTAKASAGHWGHAHRRTIRFRAIVEFVEQDGTWKLAGITVVDTRQQT